LLTCAANVGDKEGGLADRHKCERLEPQN
jgi:hypothetical protein